MKKIILSVLVILGAGLFAGCTQSQMNQLTGAVIGGVAGKKLSGNSTGAAIGAVLGSEIGRGAGGKAYGGNSNYNTMSIPGQCQEYIDNSGALRSCMKGASRSDAEQQRMIEQKAYKKGYSGGGNRY